MPTLTRTSGPFARQWTSDGRRFTCVAQRKRWSISPSAEQTARGRQRKYSRNASRIPSTFRSTARNSNLYREVTRFVKQQSVRAAGAGGRSSCPGGGISHVPLSKARLASSTLRHAPLLENRARRLGDGLKRAQELTKQAPPDIPTPEDLEEMEEIERERLEEILEAITLAGNADEVREEIGALDRLTAMTQGVERCGAEAKLSRLKDCSIVKASLIIPSNGSCFSRNSRTPSITWSVVSRRGVSGRVHPWRYEAGV